MPVVVRTAVPIPTRVLVTGMTGEDGSIDAAQLYRVADACGQSAEQVRSCLRRLVAEGRYVRTGAGRTARYEATEAGRALLEARWDRARTAFVQDAAGRGWDRKWRLVAFAVPEKARAQRDTFRDRLTAFGGASLQGGLYVSPQPWDDVVRAEAKRLGIDEHLTLVTAEDLEVAGVRDPRGLARALWPIEELSARYERFVARHRQVPDQLEQMRRRRERLDDSAFLALAFTLAVDLSECSSIDPYLPPELLPRPWPGRAARDLGMRSRRLSLLLRDQHDTPVLFRLYDQMLESLGS